MTRKIKGLGLAFFAVAAMSMVGAVGAQAAALDYTGGGAASIFGQAAAHQQHVFTTSHGQVKCTQSVFEGKAAASGTQHVEVTGTYTGCTAFGLSAVIDMNGCEYAVSGTGQAALTGTVEVKGCTSETGITITVLGGCTVTVPPQTVNEHIVFTNNAQDVTANVTATGIKYQSHGACPEAHPVATTQTSNGTYTGQATFQARVDAGSASSTHNGHTWQKLVQTGALKTLQGT